MAIGQVLDNSKRYHMQELSIVQHWIENENENPVYALSFSLIEYTVAENGDRTKTGNNFTHFIEEFYADAIIKLGEGDPSHVTSLSAVQDTIVSYIKEEFGIDVEVIL